MKVLVENATAGALRNPATGKRVDSGQQFEVDMTLELLDYRVSLGLYRVIRTVEPPAPVHKKAVAKKKAVKHKTARFKPGDGPSKTLEEALS